MRSGFSFKDADDIFKGAFDGRDPFEGFFDDFDDNNDMFGMGGGGFFGEPKKS